MTMTKHKVTDFTLVKEMGGRFNFKLAESHPHKASGYRARFRVTANNGVLPALKVN